MSDNALISSQRLVLFGTIIIYLNIFILIYQMKTTDKRIEKRIDRIEQTLNIKEGEQK